ncbi:hypothetical protein [Cytobacillus horneckiae]|uniref:hypothetical protein n=1 Tax=Cytobacillus horneckiae TaxID=549687 RepID=UPI0034CE887D
MGTFYLINGNTSRRLLIILTESPHPNWQSFPDRSQPTALATQISFFSNMDRFISFDFQRAYTDGKLQVPTSLLLCFTN